MKHLPALLGILGAVSASPALAQNTAFSGQDAAANQVEAVEEKIADAAERDVPAFGNSGRKLGWSGALSATANATSGNTDTLDVGIGARMGYFDGTNGHRFNLAMTYGETDDVATQNDTYLSYDYTREFGKNLYGYGQAQASFSEFGAYEQDMFLGAGLGYRAINNARTNWAIQTGPGFRKAETAAGKEIEEFAWGAGSYFSTKLTDSVSLYNDTTALWSESDLFATNELGLSVAMSRSLALRTSLTTKYHSDPEPGFKDVDNALGVSVVYSFN